MDFSGVTLPTSRVWLWWTRRLFKMGFWLVKGCHRTHSSLKSHYASEEHDMSLELRTAHAFPERGSFRRRSQRRGGTWGSCSHFVAWRGGQFDTQGMSGGQQPLLGRESTGFHSLPGAIVTAPLSVTETKKPFLCGACSVPNNHTGRKGFRVSNNLHCKALLQGKSRAPSGDTHVWSTFSCACTGKKERLNIAKEEGTFETG